MGIFNLLFGKKGKTVQPEQDKGRNDVRAEANVSPPTPAGGNGDRQDPQPERDYTNIVEIARILTNGNADVVRDFTLLAQDHEAFAAKYADWCGKMLGDSPERDEAMLCMTAYWLAGHDTPYKFGGYIDWKEATEEINAHLEEAIANLGYPLDMKAVAFTGEEFTDEALTKIDAYFREKGYTLVSLDSGGDCYHLFVVPLNDFDRLVRLGANLGLRFFNDFQE